MRKNNTGQWSLRFRGSHSTSSHTRSSNWSLTESTASSSAQQSQMTHNTPNVFDRLSSGHRSYPRVLTEKVNASSGVAQTPPRTASSNRDRSASKMVQQLRSTVATASMPALATSTPGLVEYEFSRNDSSGWNKWANVQAMPQAPLTPPGQVTTFSIGDLHGNAFRLIIYLQRLNFILLDETAHNRLRDLYEECGLRQRANLAGRTPLFSQSSINQNYLETIRDALEKNLRVNSQVAKNSRLILIGDMLYDRGHCDIMTLELLRWMTLSSIQYTIILSNHDLFFLQAYENGFTRPSMPLHPEHYISTLNLLRAADPVKHSMQQLVKQIYLPNLSLLDYDLTTATDNSEKLYIYTHAPFSEALFNELIKLFQAQRLATAQSQRGSAARMVKRIEHVNLLFQQIIAPEGSQFFTRNGQDGDALYNFVWNRNSDDTLVTSKPYIINIFGHMSMMLPKDNQKNAVNLDYSYLGRPKFNFGELIAFRVTDNSATMFDHHYKMSKAFIANAEPWRHDLILQEEQCEFATLQQRFQQDMQDLSSPQITRPALQRQPAITRATMAGGLLNRPGAPVPNVRPGSSRLPALNSRTSARAHAALTAQTFGSIPNHYDDDDDFDDEGIEQI